MTFSSHRLRNFRTYAAKTRCAVANIAKTKEAPALALTGVLTGGFIHSK